MEHQKFDNMEEVVNVNMYEMLIDAFMSGLDFSFFIQNTEALKKHIPKELHKEKVILLNINGDTKEDSFIEEDLFILVTQFNGVVVEIEITPEVLMGVVVNGKPLLKPFFPKVEETKEVEEKKELGNPLSKPEDVFDMESEGIRRSMEMFKKHNPHMFKDD